VGRCREDLTPDLIEVEVSEEAQLVACAGPGCATMSPYRFCSKRCSDRAYRLVVRVRQGRRGRARKRLVKR
jgi:hypothetical protein